MRSTVHLNLHLLLPDVESEFLSIPFVRGKPANAYSTDFDRPAVGKNRVSVRMVQNFKDVPTLFI